MPDSSGTWTNATQIAVAVYRGARAPVADGVSGDANLNATIHYPALAPVTYPASLGTGWYLALVMHENATNATTPPAGMSLAASGGAMVVHDTNGPVATNWPSTNVGVNASGIWANSIVQIAASGTVSRVGAAAAAGNSIAIPAGHLIGDLIVIMATNLGAAGPTLPAAYTSLGASSGSSLSTTTGYKIATVSDTAAPVADFTGTPLVGTAPLTVAFTNLSTG